MNEQDQKNYIKMTETGVEKLILKLAVPTTISMLITSLYNTADTYFVSKISVSASGATGIVFALMAILQAFGFMLGHGAGSNISRLLGAKENDAASIFASTSFFSALFLGAVIAVAGNIFIKPLMYLLGSTDTILEDASTYGMCILLGAPALISSCVMNNILRYEGRATYSMIGLTAGGILNMILDPILIFGFNMGILGAGAATVFSQYVSFIILLLPFLRGKTSSKFALKYYTRSFADISNILLTGAPNFLRQGLNSMATAVLNLQAATYGDAAIASFSIVSKCLSIVYAFALGLAQGFQPVVAFNYGAKKYDRVRKATIFTLAGCTCIIALMGAVCFSCSDKVVGLFRDEPLILEIGGNALRYVCIGLVFLPVSTVGSMFFQSTGEKGKAILASLLQGGLLYIPLLFVLPALFGLTGLEIAQPSAYVIASFIVLPLILKFLSDLKKKEIEKSSDL